MTLPGDSYRLRVGAPDEEAFMFAEETARRADAAHQLALSNFANVWPWRWLRWRRVNRQVRSEQDIVRDRIRQSQAWRRDHAARNGVTYIPVRIP